MQLDAAARHLEHDQVEADARVGVVVGVGNFVVSPLLGQLDDFVRRAREIGPAVGDDTRAHQQRNGHRTCARGGRDLGERGLHGNGVVDPQAPVAHPLLIERREDGLAQALGVVAVGGPVDRDAVPDEGLPELPLEHAADQDVVLRRVGPPEPDLRREEEHLAAHGSRALEERGRPARASREQQAHEDHEGSSRPEFEHAPRAF